MDPWDLRHVCWVGSVLSYTHVCLGGICVILLSHTCLPYWDMYDLDLSICLLGWDLCDGHDLHMSAEWETVVSARYR